MISYLMPLADRRGENPKGIDERNIAQCKGFKYAYENRDRWVRLTDQVSEITSAYCGQDPGRSYIKVNNRIYMMHKDCIDNDENIRLFIGVDWGMNSDLIE